MLKVPLTCCTQSVRMYAYVHRLMYTVWYLQNTNVYTKYEYIQTILHNSDERGDILMKQIC